MELIAFGLLRFSLIVEGFCVGHICIPVVLGVAILIANFAIVATGFNLARRACCVFTLSYRDGDAIIHQISNAQKDF